MFILSIRYHVYIIDTEIIWSHSIADRLTAIKSHNSFPRSDYFYYQTSRPESRSNFMKEEMRPEKGRLYRESIGYVRRCEGGKFMRKNVILYAINTELQKLFRKIIPLIQERIDES